jgi:hypothetical protein
MKAGQNATSPVTFAVYEGPDESSLLLSSAKLTDGNFDEHFQLREFKLSLALFAGKQYFATLSSFAPDVQSKAYFIKSTVPFFSDALGHPVDNPSVGFGGASGAVPEPQSFLLVGIGLGLLLLGAKRFDRRSSSPAQP